MSVEERATGLGTHAVFVWSEESRSSLKEDWRVRATVWDLLSLPDCEVSLIRHLQLGPWILRMTEWCTMRSTIAVVITGSPR